IGIRVEGLIQGFLSGEYSEPSARTRDRLITYGFELFNQKPYTGYGLDTFRLMSGSGLAGSALYAHNNYVELLVSSGIFGTILYYTMYLWLIAKLY
ncbi:O-antigen ligase family protein, partial [Dehalobacter sp. UNSWDHB]|uniref:O-antigen ligase family protein n=1 Tax=Dehalobacter sp. UNSWDHB TaxID=1339256 RepID=UPI00054F7F34